MNRGNELNELCKEIKRLIPSNRKENDVTKEFENFIMSLESSKIDPYEIKCIFRAYNYFNFILGTPIASGSGSGSGSSGSGSSRSGSSSSGSSSSGSGSSSNQELLSHEDQIQLLVNLYDIYRPINAMKILADQVLIKIPEIDLTWIKDPPNMKDPNKIVDRVLYQVEMAKKLNEVVPCKSLIDSTENVVKTALGLKEKDATFKKVTDLLRIAQDKVKKEIKNLPKVLT